MYQSLKGELERDLNKVLAGDKIDSPVTVNIRPVIEMLNRFPGGHDYLLIRIWDIQSAPEQYQRAWAEVSYLIYLKSWTNILSDDELAYADENKMWPSDWITFFKHEGITPIESPKILERAKLGSVHVNVYPLKDPSDLPENYNSWFKPHKPLHTPDSGKNAQESSQTLK
jgi:hypothetical protein